MKNILVIIVGVFSLTALATEQTWKNVDKELTQGTQKAKREYVDGKPAKKKRTGNSTTDGLNDAWDSMLGGVGKIVGTQQEKKKSAKK